MPRFSEPIPLFPDFFALLRALSAAKVKYLIVGADALAWRPAKLHDVASLLN